MALLEQRGYDPTTLSWSSIPTNQPEDGPSTISAEQADIFQLVEGRRRRRKNAGGASAPRTPVNNPVTGDARVQSPNASQKSSSPVSKWTPKPTQPGPKTSGPPAKPRRQPSGKTPTPGKAATATLPPGAAESPALSAPSGNAARNQPKVGSWAGVASSRSPPPSSPTSTAETQELRRELALLRAQNEKLASELNSLRTNPTTRASLSDEEENITDREIPTTVESRVAALETQ
ncbi:hypothetical protein MTO96_046365, partial [Rhipicephalus appendiculatus]